MEKLLNAQWKLQSWFSQNGLRHTGNLQKHVISTFLEVETWFSIKLMSRTCRFETCRYLNLPDFKLRLISWERVTFVFGFDLFWRSPPKIYQLSEALWITLKIEIIGFIFISMHCHTIKLQTKLSDPCLVHSAAWTKNWPQLLITACGASSTNSN